MPKGGIALNAALDLITAVDNSYVTTTATMTRTTPVIKVAGGTGGFTVTFGDPTAMDGMVGLVFLDSITSGLVTVAFPSTQPASLTMSTAKDFVMAVAKGGEWLLLQKLVGGSYEDSWSVTLAHGTSGTANTARITCTVKDATGTAVTTPHLFWLWLSDASDGEGLAAVASSGTLAAVTGAVMGTITAKLAFLIQTVDAGTATLDLLDTNKRLVYAAAQTQRNGPKTVSSVFVTGDYA